METLLGVEKIFPDFFQKKVSFQVMFDCKLITYVFDHRITIVPQFKHMQFPTIRKSDGFSNVISTVIATCFLLYF